MGFDDHMNLQQFQATVYLTVAFLALSNYLILRWIYVKKDGYICWPIRLAMFGIILWNVYASFQSLSSDPKEWLFWNMMVYSVTVYIAPTALVIPLYLWYIDRYNKPWTFKDMGIMTLIVIPYIIATAIFSYIVYVYLFNISPNLWMIGYSSGSTGYGIYHEIHGPLWDVHIVLGGIYMYAYIIFTLYLTFYSRKLISRVLFFVLFVAGFVPTTIGLILFVIFTRLYRFMIPIDPTPIIFAAYSSLILYASYRYTLPLSPSVGKKGMGLYDLEASKSYLTLSTPDTRKEILRLLRAYADVGFNVIIVSTSRTNYWVKHFKKYKNIRIIGYNDHYFKKNVGDIGTYTLFVMDIANYRDFSHRNIMANIYYTIKKINDCWGALIVIMDVETFKKLQATYLVHSLLIPLNIDRSITTEMYEKFLNYLKEYDTEMMKLMEGQKRLQEIIEKKRHALITLHRYLSNEIDEIKSALKHLRASTHLENICSYEDLEDSIDILKESLANLAHVSQYDSTSTAIRERKSKVNINSVIDKILTKRDNMIKSQDLVFRVSGHGYLNTSPPIFESIMEAYIDCIIKSAKKGSNLVVDTKIIEGVDIVVIEAHYPLDMVNVSVVELPREIRPNNLPNGQKWLVGKGTAMYMYIVDHLLKRTGNGFDIKLEDNDNIKFSIYFKR